MYRERQFRPEPLQLAQIVRRIHVELADQLCHRTIVAEFGKDVVIAHRDQQRQLVIEERRPDRRRRDRTIGLIDRVRGRRRQVKTGDRAEQGGDRSCRSHPDGGRYQPPATRLTKRFRFILLRRHRDFVIPVRRRGARRERLERDPVLSARDADPVRARTAGPAVVGLELATQVEDVDTNHRILRRIEIRIAVENLLRDLDLFRYAAGGGGALRQKLEQAYVGARAAEHPVQNDVVGLLAEQIGLMHASGLSPEEAQDCSVQRGGSTPGPCYGPERREARL